MAKKLLSAGAKLDDVDSRGYTALHYASRSGNEELVLLLLQRGALVNAVNKNRETPLHVACRQRRNHGLVANAATRSPTQPCAYQQNSVAGVLHQFGAR